MKHAAWISLLLFALLQANKLSAADYYWVHPATPTANWSDAANWRTTSGGATAHATPPTASDNVIFDANSFSASGCTVVIDVAATCANMNWTGATNGPTLAINNPLTIHGNLTFISGMSITGTATVTFAGGSTQTITMAGKSFGGDAVFNKDVGTAANLADAFTAAGNLIFTQGNFNSNNYAIVAGNFSFDGTGGRNVNLGSSTVTLSGTSFSVTAGAAATLTSSSATFSFTNTSSAITVNLGSAVGRTFGNFTFAGTTSARNITLQGNNTHTVGSFTLGAFTNFTRPTGSANLTFGNFSAVNNSNIQFNHSGTLTFSGTTAINTTSGASTLTLASTVTNVTHTGNVTFGGNAGITLNYNNSGTVTFNGTTTFSNATAPNWNTVTFASSVTNVLHNNNVTLNNRTVINYNNSGFVRVGTSPANRNLMLNGSSITLTAAASVTTFSVTGNTNLGNNNTVTLNNSGNISFGDAASDTFTSGDGTTLSIGAGSAGKNLTISGNATFGTASNVTISNSGNVSVGGNLTYNGSGTFQYANGGTVTFGGNVNATNISGTLGVSFTNGSTTTYNDDVVLSTAAGATNGIVYQFAGSQTANVNADFSVTGACDNLITIGRTGSGAATLNLTATPANRNWSRVSVSNIDASSQPNNIRAYAYVNGGGNSGIDFRHGSTASNRTLYWVAGGPQTGTNTLWSNPINWSYEPDEYVPAVCIPTAQDSVVFGHHNISFSVTNPTVDVDGNYAVGGMRWSATDVTPVMPILRSVGGTTRTLTVGGAFDCYRSAGQIEFQNENAAARLNFIFTGAVRTPVNGWNDIRSGGVNFPREVIFNGNADNTRWRLLDHFSARVDAGANPVNNGSVYLQRGVFDTNGQNLVLGRFNAFQYGTTNFTAPRELKITGSSHWTFQGRTGGLTAGSVANTHVLDLQGSNLTFNAPGAGSYWYFSGANADSTASTEGTHVYIALSRWVDAVREVPDMGFGYRLLDIDIGTDNNQNFPIIFRELKLVPNTLGNQDRQIYIQPWGAPPGTQHVFKGIVDFGNNTRANPNTTTGTVINGTHVVPNATWSNVNRFEKDVFIGTNCELPFWGSYRFDGKVTVGGSSVVWFRASSGITAYQFNDDVTLGSAVVANFQARVVWPNGSKTLTIGQESIAYVGDIPSGTLPPVEYQIAGQYNTWANIILLNQGRLVLNNGKGPGGNTITNTINNLTLGEFSVVEFNTEIFGSGANPQTQITGYMTTSFVSNCSVWATIRSLLEGKQADVRFTNAHTGANAVGRLVVKDILVSTAPPNLEINQGTDAGNNTGVTFNGGSLAALNFYWVGGTNKNKTLNPHRKAADTNFDGIPDDNGDNVMWSNPANWYTEPASMPVRNNGELTEAMIMQNNQCVPTLVDNVYFLDDSFQGGIQHSDFTKHRRRVIVDIPQAQARNFMWFLTTPAAMNAAGKVTTPGQFVTGTPATGPAIFTNEQQPILPTTEFQVAGNLRWAPTGGPMSMNFVTNPNLTTFETILRNDFVSRFSFVGQGNMGAPTTHTIESNGQRFAAEVFFDNRYSTWYPIDSLDINSHRHGTRYPQLLPASVAENVPTPWTRASVTIHQGALNMGSNAYKTGQPRRISLEGDWTISGLFGFAHFDASTSEVVFDGSQNSNNANDINIITNENFEVPAPAQPVVQLAGDPNGNYDPARRRFYDLRIFKRNNTFDVRVLNSPVSVLRNIHIQRGRLWDNNEGASVPMQIKGKISGTGTFQMDDGTTLRLGSSQAAGAANRYMNAGNPIYNWGTEFPASVNGYPTTFPLGYAKADISLAPTSTVVYWVNGHQNVSIVPDYGNIEFIGHTAPTDFGTNWENLRKRHLIREPHTGNVNYAGGNHAPSAASLPVFTPTHGGTLTIQGNWTQQNGIDFLDNGNQINLTGSNPTFAVGAWAILTLGAGLDDNALDALNRTLPLANHATTFPTGTLSLNLDANSIINYNAGANQTVRGLNGPGGASYGHLLIANRDRSVSAPLPILAQKTLDGPATVRGQLRIYPNAHLLDNGNQISMTATGRLHMYRVLPAVNSTPVPANLDGLLDLYDLRTLPTNNGVTAGGTFSMINSESRLSLGNATTATEFPTNVPNNRVFLQGRTTIVYNAGVPQNIRAFTGTDTTQMYAHLVLVNPAASATAPVNKTAVNQAGSGAANPMANTSGDATVNFYLRGDLIIGPNNSFVDNGYQVRNPNSISEDGYFRMPVLKATADGITPTSGRATLLVGGNPTDANGVSRIMLGTAAIATQFPINYGGNNDIEIDFEISPDNNLYGNVVYNSGRRQIIRGLNSNLGGGVRCYANITFTNPSSTPNGPVPKSSNGQFRVRGTITVNPNNNLRLRHTVTPHTPSTNIPRLHMFSSVATATSPTAIAHNDQNVGGPGAVNGPALLTIGTRGGNNASFPGFAAFNATYLYLEEGTTVVYGFGTNSSTVSSPANQNVQALGDDAAQATYFNLWFTCAQSVASSAPAAEQRPAEVVHKTLTGSFAQNRVRGSLIIGPQVNLVDNGIQIAGTGSGAQPFRMYASVANMAAYMNTPAAHGLPSLPTSYATNAVFESIAYGPNSPLYGGSTSALAADGASVLTLGNATTATQFPEFSGTSGFVNSHIEMEADTYVRYNAGVNQTIRALFGTTLGALNNYAHVELVNPATSGTAVKTLAGNVRIRGNLMVGGRVASDRFLPTISYQSHGQANNLTTNNYNINIQGNWVVFSTGNRNSVNSAFAFSGSANAVNNLFTAGTGMVTFEGGNRAQVLASGSVVSGTGTGFAQTVSNRFYMVEIDKGTAGAVHGRTVYLREDPMLIEHSATFTNGFFWSNADGSENNGTVNRQDDDNQITFLNAPGLVQVAGPGTFPGAPGPHHNSYVVGAVRKIGTASTPVSSVGGANTFDFPVGHTPFVTGNLPDTWLSRGYYYAPCGVLDLTANHDFVARYYGTNPNMAGTTIPAGIRPQDLTNAAAGDHYPTNVKQPSLRYINESEFWTIDYSNKIGPATPSGLPFRAKLSWDSSPNRTAVNTTFSTAPLQVAHWTNKGSGLMWYDEDRSAMLGTSAAGVQVSKPTSFNGPFNNSDDNLSILPVEIVSFRVRAVSQEPPRVQITWQTAWERNNDYFEIERSRDGIRFQSIARVPAKGQNGFSNGMQTYVYDDEQPWLGKNYYRLKQVDFDGTITYSKIEMVIFERNALAATASNMEVYPNPLPGDKQSLKVVLPEGGAGEGWLVMWDMTGREIYRERIEDRQTLIEIEPRETQGRLADGAYIIRVLGREKTFTAKVVVE